jgi:putative flippase GtrA
MMLARYMVVQVVAYGLDLGIFYVLYRSGAAEPVVANLAGKVLSALFSFLAHRSFTFRIQGAKRGIGQAVRYFSLLALSAPISSAVLAGVLLLVSNVMAAKILSDVLCALLNFLLSKHLVFAHGAVSGASSPDARRRAPSRE